MARLIYNKSNKTALNRIEDILTSGEYKELEDKNFCAIYYAPENKNDYEIIDSSCPLSDCDAEEYLSQVGILQDKFKSLETISVNKDNIDYLKAHLGDKKEFAPIFAEIYKQIKKSATALDVKNSLGLNQNVISLLKECGYLSIGIINTKNCKEDDFEILKQFGFTQSGDFLMKPFKAFAYSIDEDLSKMLQEREIYPQYWSIETLRSFAKNYIKQDFSQKRKKFLKALNGFFSNFLSNLSLKELLGAKEKLADKFFYPSINSIKNHLLNSNSQDNFDLPESIQFDFKDKEKNDVLETINYLFLINNLTYRLDSKILNKNNTQEYFLSLKDNIDESLVFLDKSLKYIDAKSYKNNFLKFITSIHEAIRSFETNAVNVISSEEFNKMLTSYNKLVGSFMKKYCNENDELNFDIIVSQNGEKTGLSDIAKKSTSKIFNSIIRALTGKNANSVLKAIENADGNISLKVTKDAQIKLNDKEILQEEQEQDHFLQEYRSFFSQNFTNEVKDKNGKLIINFIGAPGVGKSYSASKMQELLSEKLGIKVPLVREVASGLILQNKEHLLKDQLYVTGEQIAREKEALHHCPIGTSDSPPFLGKFYISDRSQLDELEKIIEENENNRIEINVFIKHNQESLENFSEHGRIHTKEQSLEIEQAMLKEIKDKNFIFTDRSTPINKIAEQIFETPEFKKWEQNNNNMYLQTENKQSVTAYRLRELVNGLDFKNMSAEQLATKVATSLALTTGFLGSVNYSTLQHSLNVCKLVANKIKNDPEFENLDKTEIVLKALFHDAVEALIMGDIPTPIKNTMQNYYAEEERYIKEIYSKLGIKDTQYNSVIDWADKTERNTFMRIYFNNSNNLINAVDIYLQHLQAKLNFALNNEEKQKMAKNILREYKNYLEYGDTPMLGNTTLDFIETFRLKNNGGALSMKEFYDNELSMEVNVPVEKTLIEFAGVARNLGLNISNDDILKEYQSVNTMPQETYKLSRDFQIQMVEEAMFKMELDKHRTNFAPNNTETYDNASTDGFDDDFDDIKINGLKL